MRRIRRMMALSVAVLLVAGLLGSAALAAGARSNAVSALKTGKWYSPGSTALVLRVKVAKDALVTANWKGNSEEKLYVNLYQDADRKHYLTNLYTYQVASGTQSLALQKGTYYLSLFDSTGSSRVKFSVSTLKDKMNYCPSRAVTMKKGVKYIQGGHTPMNSCEYDWFKVRLTKKQRITVHCSTNIGSVQFRNSGLETLKSEAYTKKAYRTQEVLAPGTYYMRIYNHGSYNPRASLANTIWWD